MGANVTKAELISNIAETAGIPKNKAEKVFNAVIQNIQDGLKKGKNIPLVGFGTFTVVKRKARNGRNPQTGKTIKIAASTVPKFKPGKNLREAVNNKKGKKKK